MAHLKRVTGPLPQRGQFLVYPTQDGRLKVDVRFDGNMAWLTQQQMAELFQTTKQNIGKHLKNIFAEGELAEQSVVNESFTTAADGKNYETRFYNLDAIISVGYRVKSSVAIRFRIWATQQLREYMRKGFLLDDERLKNPDQPFNYFEELTQCIQDIRTSERRLDQKITDIYATSIDYDPTQEVSLNFFKTVQNKVHWAITGETAAEIIHGRADGNKPNHISDWGDKLNGFLTLNDRSILSYAGHIAHEMALTNAESEYEQFKLQNESVPRQVDNDFERALVDIQNMSSTQKTKAPELHRKLTPKCGNS